jgi:hypothetical protein
MKWFLEKNFSQYSIISDLFKPKVTETTMNMCDGFKHKNHKKFSEYDQQTQDDVKLFLSYIFEVLSSEVVEASYDYWLKWIANVCKGKKNNAVPYLKGPQGIGKSFLSEMLQRHVI